MSKTELNLAEAPFVIETDSPGAGSPAGRAGRFASQTGGYRAFVPASLPPNPDIRYDGELRALLSKADRALGRLDGASEILPNPDLFVLMYVRREAVLSSQIEGTRASLTDLLEYEAALRRAERVDDVAEVANYVAAMKHGLERLRTLPVSLRLIREIHQVLMTGVRGGDRTHGAFRTVQNWIGPVGSSLRTADFIPPPVPEMLSALDAFERFLHSQAPIPELIRVGLAHAQFESIHPFVDGNGRVGRLLVTFLLCEKEILAKPLLYTSYFIRKHKLEYYDRLQSIRYAGDWEGWLKFFLRGVFEVAQDATQTAHEIVSLRERDREIVGGMGRSAASAWTLLDSLFHRPIVNAKAVQEATDLSVSNANALLRRFLEAGILVEITGKQRNRLYAYDRYLRLFDD